jgi:hypothetical protein
MAPPREYHCAHAPCPVPLGLPPVWLSLSRIESVTACPERDVPAARNVTGVWCFAAMGRIVPTSFSVCTLTTI